MARVLVLDVIGRKGFYEAECNDLDDYYRELKCDTFDIATRKIGDKYFDMFVDDNGLFVEKPIPSVLDNALGVMLVGNVIFANHDEEGNTTSLTDADIDLIKQYSLKLTDWDEEKQEAVIFDAIYGADY